MNYNPDTPDGQKRLQSEGVPVDPTPYYYDSLDELQQDVAEEQSFTEGFSKAFGYTPRITRRDFLGGNHNGKTHS